MKIARSGTVLNWNSTMPAVARRQRHDSPKRGDNARAIRRSSGGFFDANLQVMAGEIWFAHWATPARNGYTRVVDAKSGRVRRMTRRERRSHGNAWGVSGIKRWRRRNGERPLTQAEGLALCVRYGAVAIQEVKSPAFGVGGWAARAVATCVRHNHPAWFKTLPNMRGAQSKVAKFRAAGGQIALIYGKGVRGRVRRVLMTRRVARTWSVQPNATW